MPAGDMGEKTEAPTPRRRQEARDDGKIAKSTDLTSGVLLLGAVLLLAIFGMRFLVAARAMLTQMLGAGEITQTGSVGEAWRIALTHAWQMWMPLALGFALIALMAGVMQVGVYFSFKPMTPKLSNLSPIKGVQKIFSTRGAMQLLMSLLKVTIVVIVAAISIHLDWPKIMALVRLETAPMFAAAAWLVWLLALKIALVLLLLGILDYAYQRWQHEQELRMTKQEVKEEMKRMDGDPLIKQRRARVARQLVLQRIQQDVPKADVVVSNPTHFAVALRYDSGQMAAPRVVAKGADFIALRIRQIAAAHGVPVIERPPLARALYRGVEVGQEVPPQYYAAVAEILAYVYRLNGEAAPRRSA